MQTETMLSDLIVIDVNNLVFLLTIRPLLILNGCLVLVIGSVLVCILSSFLSRPSLFFSLNIYFMCLYQYVSPGVLILPGKYFGFVRNFYFFIFG